MTVIMKKSSKSLQNSLNDMCPVSPRYGCLVT